jgi:predicted alpha/beta hydrolase family esterase
MKKIYVIHGWDATPDSNWYPWLKGELEESFDLKVEVPQMPNTEVPVIAEWVGHLKNVVSSPNEDTYFVGHSLGCQTILRYLETLDNVKVGGVLLVAGCFDIKNLENEEIEKIAEPWIKTPIDFEKVKNSIGKLKVILSNNDPFVDLEENAEIFKNKLNAGVFVEKEAGHFTGSKYLRILTELLDVLGTSVKLPNTPSQP